MRLVFDIEANGLYKTATILWCIAVIDIDTKERYTWNIHSETPLLQFVTETLGESTVLIGHNIINFDLPFLKKMLDWEPPKGTVIKDTLVMSRLAYPDRAKPEGFTGRAVHGLDAWGYRVGRGKPAHDDWSQFTPEMMHRCVEDTEINLLTFYMLEQELIEFSEESLELETWIYQCITRQEHYGIRFDKVKALEYLEFLDNEVTQIDDEVIPELPKEIEVIGVEVKNPFLKTGGYSKRIRDYAEEAYNGEQTICGPFTRIRIHDFDLGRVQKVKEYLLDSGWQPELWNFSKTTGDRTSPKLDGEFRGIDGRVPSLIKRRISLLKRHSIIKGWLGNGYYDDDGNFLLSAGANPCGTPTFRFKHNTVVNVPKANVDKETGELIWDITKQKDLFGTQMRDLFIARAGYVVVGHDASGLELRMLAHYLNDEEFTRQILEGDIHTFNMEKAGLPDRDSAKTFIYALIYGAGDARIGAIVGGGSEEGKIIKANYFAEFPAIKRFIAAVKRSAAKGWLKGLDGRKVWVRKDDSGRLQRSKAPNLLLQHAGAVVMKRSCKILWDSVEENNLDAHKILDMHDEGQSEVKNNPETIELYSKLAVESIKKAGEFYNMNIPLDAEAKVGRSWAETH